MTVRPAMIFAAGLGTRMGELTRDRPKPLLELAPGHTLLDHALALVRGAEAAPVVVNAHAHAGQIAAHLARCAQDVALSLETDRLETGGGLKAAFPRLLAPGHRGPVLTLNADMFWRGPNPLVALADAWDGARMGALLALVRREAAIAHQGPGDFALDRAGRLARRTPGAAAPFVFAGAHAIDPTALDPFPPGVYSLNAVWDRLLAEGRLFGLVWEGTWIDVGRPEGLDRARAALAP